MKNPTAIPDTAKFPLGRIVSTPGALDACTPEYLRECLLCHIQGDWGVVSADDAAETTSPSGRALAFSRPIRSIRPTRTGNLWIITEADRSATTFLLPSEY